MSDAANSATILLGKVVVGHNFVVGAVITCC